MSKTKKEQKGKVISVNISAKKGEKKTPVDCAVLRHDFGIIGDAHADDWHRQISMLGMESIQKIIAKGMDVVPGDFAENITTEGLVLYELPIGTQFKINHVMLELTQIGKECHEGCAIKQQTGDCVMPREGVFVRVLERGKIHPGDIIEVLS